MHKNSLRLLAFFAVATAVAAASARPDAGTKHSMLSMEDVRTALSPQRLMSAIPDALTEVRHKSTQALHRVRSATKVTARDVALGEENTSCRP
eukprot:3616171-Rhodomonas_salina.2